MDQEQSIGEDGTRK